MRKFYFSGPTCICIVEAVINGTNHVTALMDTGSSSSLITEGMQASLSLSVLDTSTAENLVAINNNVIPTLGKVALQISVGGLNFDIVLHCVHCLPSPTVLGIDFVCKAHLVLDFKSGCSWCEAPDDQRIKFPLLGVPTRPSNCVKTDTHVHDDMPPQPVSQLDNPVLIGEEHEQLDALLHEFGDVMSDQPGHTNIAQHHVIVDNASP